MNACIFPLLLLLIPSAVTAQSVTGFTPQRAAEQIRLEQQFDQQLKAEIFEAFEKAAFEGRFLQVSVG